MATGYTSDIHDGKPVTIDQFILTCARAFGPTIRQRDEDISVPPRRVEADTSYMDDAIARYSREVKEATDWTAAQATQRAQAAYADAVERWENRSADRQAIRDRYDAMLDQVRAWEPPTPQHQGLKDFMIQQLEESIRFDCSGTYDEVPTIQTGEEFRSATLAKASRMLSSYVEQRAEEINRVAAANAWIDALYAALPGKNG